MNKKLNLWKFLKICFTIQGWVKPKTIEIEFALLS